METEAVVSTLFGEIQAQVEKNLIGFAPVSFERYQELAEFLWGVKKHEVKSVRHDLGTDNNALVFEIILDRPIEFVDVSFKIED